MVGFLGNLEIPGGWDVVNQLKPPLCVWTILYEGENNCTWTISPFYQTVGANLTGKKLDNQF